VCVCVCVCLYVRVCVVLRLHNVLQGIELPCFTSAATPTAAVAAAVVGAAV